jgi:hypothetical protein
MLRSAPHSRPAPRLRSRGKDVMSVRVCCAALPAAAALRPQSDTNLRDTGRSPAGLRVLLYDASSPGDAEQTEEVRGSMLNRCAITVKARQPFLDWLRSLPELADTTLERWNEDGVAYLLPVVEDESDDLASLLPLCFDLIFERELAAWEEDCDRWPATRDLPTFLSWFEPQLRAVVIDLVDMPLVDDES